METTNIIKALNTWFINSKGRFPTTFETFFFHTSNNIDFNINLYDILKKSKKTYIYITKRFTPNMQKTISNEIKIKFVDNGFRPYFNEDEEPRQIYRVFVSYNGKKTSFTFGDSLQNGYDGKTPESNPEEYRQTILDCLVSDSYTPANFNDFCSEYGYNEDSRKAFKTYKRIVKQAEKINKLFNKEELEALYNEVNN